MSEAKTHFQILLAVQQQKERFILDYNRWSLHDIIYHRSWLLSLIKTHQ